MEHIPYFDAHCDTIYRCLRTGAQLRENDGHLDLHRASSFGRFAQVFALYQDPEELPRGSTMVREGRLLHRRFLQEMEQNRDVIVPCRTGAEVDRAAADGKMAAILSIEGAELIGCDQGCMVAYSKGTGETEYKKVDTHLFTSWKDGYYEFEEMELGELMPLLGRWYAVGVDFEEPELKRLKFSGRLQRYETVADLVKMLEYTGDVVFEVKNDRILVRKR